MDRRPSRFSDRERDDYSERRNSRQRNLGRDRSPGRGRSPGRAGRSPARGRSPGRGRSPARDRSPLRRSPFRGAGGSGGRNDFGGSRRSHSDSRSGSFGGDAPPFPNDPLRREPRFGDRRGMMPGPPGDLGPKLPPPSEPGMPTVHCELIVVDMDGRQRGYAENVRMRLTSSGVSTELVPVRAGGGADMNATLTSAVQDAVRRRILYACIINEQNEMHRSMTVNILHGQLQEHRNMPLESAVTLIMRNYEQWMASDGSGGGGGAGRGAQVSDPSQPAGRTGAGASAEFQRPGENVARMLRMVIDGRCLVVEELDEVIGYFQQQRDIMAKAQRLAPASKSTPSGGGEDDPSRRELQDKILQMLEKDPSLAQAAKTVLVPGGSAGAAGSGEYRRPSRFDTGPQSARDVDSKRPSGGGYQEVSPSRPPGATDTRGSSFHGYGQAPNSASGIGGEFKGAPDKTQPLFPGSQATSGPEEDTRPSQGPPFSQPPPGGMNTYARPPPSGMVPGSLDIRGPYWANTALAASNGRPDWRPGFGGPPGNMPDYHNPMQQRLPGNWQSDAMPFSRFH